MAIRTDLVERGVVGSYLDKVMEEAEAALGHCTLVDCFSDSGDDFVENLCHSWRLPYDDTNECYDRLAAKLSADDGLFTSGDFYLLNATKSTRLFSLLAALDRIRGSRDFTVHIWNEKHETWHAVC